MVMGTLIDHTHTPVEVSATILSTTHETCCIITLKATKDVSISNNTLSAHVSNADSFGYDKNVDINSKVK
jgi:hypothetical protein